MIRIEVYENEQGYQGFSSKGHAGFSEAGKDIVCAAVSVLIINTINAIESFTEDAFFIDEDEAKGWIKVTFPDPLSNEADLLMKALTLGLDAIEREYGNQYISVIFKEV